MREDLNDAGFAVDEQGRPLPAAPHIEWSLLGTLMLEPTHENPHEAGGGQFWPAIRSVLSQEDFFDPGARLVYETMIALRERDGLPIGPAAVAAMLHGRLSVADAGKTLLDQLKSWCGGAFLTIDDAVANAELVLMLAKRRRAHAAAMRLAERLMDGGEQLGLDDLLAQATAEIGGEAMGRREQTTLGEQIAAAFEPMLGRRSGSDLLPETGIAPLDEAFGGRLHGRRLYCLEGQTGGFKSGTALTIAVAIASQGFPVGYIDLELGRVEMNRRMLAAVGRFPKAWFDSDDARPALIAEAKRVLQMGLPLHIRSASALTGEALKSEVERMVAEHRIRLLVIDYWQKIEKPEEIRKKEFAYLNDMAKWMRDGAATKHGLAVITTSQVTSKGEVFMGQGLQRLSGWVGRLNRCKAKLIGPENGSQTQDLFWLKVFKDSHGPNTGRSFGSEDLPSLTVNPKGLRLEAYC